MYNKAIATLPCIVNTDRIDLCWQLLRLISSEERNKELSSLFDKTERLLVVVVRG